jgi:hypothetical protein
MAAISATQPVRSSFQFSRRKASGVRIPSIMQEQHSPLMPQLQQPVDRSRREPADERVLQPPIEQQTSFGSVQVEEEQESQAQPVQVPVARGRRTEAATPPVAGAAEIRQGGAGSSRGGRSIPTPQQAAGSGLGRTPRMGRAQGEHRQVSRGLLELPANWLAELHEN